MLRSSEAIEDEAHALADGAIAALATLTGPRSRAELPPKSSVYGLEPSVPDDDEGDADTEAESTDR